MLSAGRSWRRLRRSTRKPWPRSRRPSRRNRSVLRSFVGLIPLIDQSRPSNEVQLSVGAFPSGCSACTLSRLMSLYDVWWCWGHSRSGPVSASRWPASRARHSTRHSRRCVHAAQLTTHISWGHVCMLPLPTLYTLTVRMMCQPPGGGVAVGGQGGARVCAGLPTDHP